MKRPKKSLGQNFLIDKNIINKILLSINPTKKNILEIGPGTGNLTNEIFKSNPSNLILIEKDKNLFFKLKKIYRKNIVEIINGDILDQNLEKIIKKK